MRYPTYTELYYNRGGAQGSINLRPESAWNYELGYKQKSGQVYNSGALFHRRSKDLIDWVKYAGDPITYASNITSLALTGIEGSMQYNASKRKALLRNATIQAAFMRGVTPEVDFSSLYYPVYMCSVLMIKMKILMH